MSMKKNFYRLVFCIIFCVLFTSCVKTSGEKEGYGSEFSISPMDSSVRVSKNLITIFPSENAVTYTLSGYFCGQIIVSSKNTVLKLDNAYIENPFGKSAIKCKTKTEISSVGGSVNYIVSKGRSYERQGALHSQKGVVIGGSGTLYVKGNVCHAVEATDVKLKGSGNCFFEGSKKGSAICCENFFVDEDKNFSCYLLNSKNGIKADQTINIASGNFYIQGNSVALKTENHMSQPKKNHFIKISGGNFYLKDNDVFYLTDDGKFSTIGANFSNE